MELFNVIVPKSLSEEKELLRERLIEGFQHIHIPQGSIQLHCQNFRSYFTLKCSGVLPDFQVSEWGKPILQEAANILSAFIMDQVEMKLLREVISGPYRYEEPHDVQAIEKYCTHLLNQPEETEGMPKPRVRRQEKVAAEIRKYFEEQTELNLQGLIRFRLADYRDELKEVVEYAIDEYIMDQQYQEFISLLKYFVYIQEAKIPVAHLMHHGGHDFTLLNDKMAPIETKEFDSFTVELLDREINFEDMIVSTLISVSPQNIVIHTRDPEEQVVKTIMQIFEDRAQICVNCKGCHPVLGVHNKDQLSP
jgi:putative sporulation protein YtxC